MRRRSRRLVLVAFAAVLVAPARRAGAAGFLIQEQSARGIGTSFVGEPAIAEDATAAYFNPAGMTRLDGTWLTASGSLIQFQAEFENRGSIVNPTLGDGRLRGDPTQDAATVGLVPAGYLTHKLTDRWSVGLAVNSPFGLRTDYDRDWVGRYSALLSDLKTFNFSPTIAVRLFDGLSIGAGPDIQYAKAELSNMLDLGSICALNAPRLGQPPSICPALGLPPQSVDGFIRIKGDSWAVGGNVGILWEISSRTRLGLTYRSRIDHTLGSTARFSVPQKAAFLQQASGALRDTGGRAELKLPDMIRFGFLHHVNEHWAVMGGIDWTNWSRFEELVFKFDNPAQPTLVQPEHWNNAVRGGLAVAWSPWKRWTFRLGSAYDQSPVPNARDRTPRVPDSDRVWLSTGLGYQWNDQLRVDLGYAHLFAPGTTKINNPDPVTGDVVRGTYEGSANIMGAQVSMQFD